MNEPIRFLCDGEPVDAEPGQTIAAALTAADVWTLRRTRGTGRPRGVFCGMGVCFDCLVTLNGRPDVRSCVERVVAGDEVVTTGVRDV
ncbi:2Fe-2S iron-sulfur cluster protein [Stackebrandtia albiflava]|uniref:2Fe-2S iron-sulfur cluster protein n=1 Tax=Stackebrandtia albiflava TaxID=406432 RepID=A0A562VD92_9ACTN|nr:(2Fe-2S)-binding protein [Stackebrandtia albiflava]TWJ15844.1 2Fe-2S iron-sulfur cluster protein [Stackebrandtia albiflava]